MTPTDKVVWQVIKLQARAHGASAFPSYEMIRALANVRSDATIARAMAILRATRWLTLCARIRDAHGRFRGNVYAVHDEPLPLADTLHLDTAYLDFLSAASTHHHGRVRTIAGGVLETIHADVATGEDVMAQGNRQLRRLQAARIVHGSTHKQDHYFSLNPAALHRLQNLKTVDTDMPHPTSNSKDGACAENPDSMGDSPSSNFEPSKFEVCSSSSSKNKNTTTTDPKIWQRAKLRYPDKLNANERYLAQRYLEAAPAALRQRVLDVLEERLTAIEAGAEPLLYGPLPYLRTLCQRAAAGTLIPPAAKGGKLHEQPTPKPQSTDAPNRLTRSHLINEICQLEFMMAHGADPSGQLARQVQSLREKLAARSRPQPKRPTGDTGV